MADRENGRIQIWLDDSVNSTKTISGNLSNPFSIFVTIADDIYIDNSPLNGRIDKWTFDTNCSSLVMYAYQRCYGLFVDITDTLYCSMRNYHQVVKKSLHSDLKTVRIAAGQGCVGSSSTMLNLPCGIFVDVNFDLYVADTGNNRIQRFPSGHLNGTTVAGSGSLAVTIALNGPTGIVLDADKYLFIADSNNRRIIGSGPNGFRCLVGCSGFWSSVHSQLYIPWSLSFDSHGNLFVTDQLNSRVQKFVLLTNLCSKCKNNP